MRKIIPVVAAGAALAVVGTTVGYASLDKDVTVSVDGQARSVATRAGTVGELLADQGLTVSDRDVVAPAASTKVTDGTRVAVQFARQVTFTVDGKPRTLWTTATSLDAALGALGLDTTGAALSTSRSTSIGRQGLAVEIATLKMEFVDEMNTVRERRKQNQELWMARTEAAIRDGIKSYSNWPTIPQLYVKGEFVGGCDIIREMFQAGELQTLLADKGVIAAAPAA